MCLKTNRKLAQMYAYVCVCVYSCYMAAHSAAHSAALEFCVCVCQPRRTRVVPRAGSPALHQLASMLLLLLL